MEFISQETNKTKPPKQKKHNSVLMLKWYYYLYFQ